jgi:peptidoglycan hydrolase-like protein with peptidoglycan-binding domain
MKKSILIFALILFLSSIGSSLWAAEPSGQTTPMTSGQKINLSKADIMKVQQILKSEGFYTGPIDGIAGPSTRSALQEYQRQHNLLITGRIDEQTAQSMGLQITPKTYTKIKEGSHKKESGAVSTLKNIGTTIKEGAVTGGKAVGKAAKGVGEEISDATITSAIKTKFASDDQIKALDIDVDTENGVVTLTPHVQGVNIDRAVEIARNTPGVKEVRVKPVDKR